MQGMTDDEIAVVEGEKMKRKEDFISKCLRAVKPCGG
jgi:hypothetical protein